MTGRHPHRPDTRISAPEFQRIARRIMDENGLTDWRFQWGRGLGVVGTCNRRTKTLRFSKVAFTGATYGQGFDTITHEVAHALTHGVHSPEWRAKFMELGGSGERTWKAHEEHTFGPAMVAKRKARKPRKVTWVVCKCPACGYTDERTKRSRSACGRCCRAAGGGYREEFALDWFRYAGEPGVSELIPYPMDERR